MKRSRNGSARRFTVALGVVLGGVVLASCGSATSGPTVEDAGGTELVKPAQSAWDEIVKKGKEEGSVTVFSSAANSEVFFKKFEEKYPEITVTVERQPTSQLIPRLDQELSVPNPSADVAYHATPNWFVDKSEQKAFAPIQYSPEVEEATSKLAEKTRYYAPTMRNPFVLLYNTELGEKPTSIQDAVEKAKGKHVAVLEATSPALAFQWMTWDQNIPGFLDDLAALNPVVAPTAVPLAQSMAAGEYAYIFPPAPGVADALIEQGAPIEEVVMGENATGIQYGTGVLASSQHPNASQLFVNWLMSPENTEFMLESFGPGATPAKGSDGLEWGDIPILEKSGVTTEELDKWRSEVWSKKMTK